MFLAAALSIVFIVALKIDEADASFDLIASLHFFIEVFKADFLIVFLKVFFLATSTLFIDDFILGKPFTSCDFIGNIDTEEYSNMKIFKKQGDCYTDKRICFYSQRNRIEQYCGKLYIS